MLTSRVLVQPLRENLQYLTAGLTSAAQPRASKPSMGQQPAPLQWLSQAAPIWSYSAPLLLLTPRAAALWLLPWSSQVKEQPPRAKADQASRAPQGTAQPYSARPALPHWLIQHIRLGIQFGSEMYFCFSKVKCARDTLNPGLSPKSHDIPVPTWPVKTPALCREILWIWNKGRRSLVAHELCCLRTGSSNFYFQDYLFLLHLE